LARDFAKGGVLEGKEVYGFSPSTITVIEGDTLRLTFVNPEDDEHTFVLPGCTAEDRESIRLPDCTMHLPGQAVTHGIYVARRAGIFPITCDLASHAPFMAGQLVILGAAAASSRR
ncbi:MAG: cupredoxin domain-containing protein, partial [Gemmatimonadales bacterium]